MTMTHDHDFTTVTVITNPDHAQNYFYLPINNVIVSGRGGGHWRYTEGMRHE